MTLEFCDDDYDFESFCAWWTQRSYLAPCPIRGTVTIGPAESAVRTIVYEDKHCERDDCNVY